MDKKTQPKDAEALRKELSQKLEILKGYQGIAWMMLKHLFYLSLVILIFAFVIGLFNS